MKTQDSGAPQDSAPHRRTVRGTRLRFVELDSVFADGAEGPEESRWLVVIVPDEDEGQQRGTGNGTNSHCG